MGAMISNWPCPRVRRLARGVAMTSRSHSGSRAKTRRHQDFVYAHHRITASIGLLSSATFYTRTTSDLCDLYIIARFRHGRKKVAWSGLENDANCCKLLRTPGKHIGNTHSGSDANKFHLARFHVRVGAPPSLRGAMSKESPLLRHR
jgi:hypothetical protein